MKLIVLFALGIGAALAAAQTPQYLPRSGGTLTGQLTAPIVNNVCNAYAKSPDPTVGIAACLDLETANGGIIDATGYTGSLSLGALTITKPVTLKLGQAYYDVTAPIEALNLSNLIIEGNGAVITCDTGAGRACLELLGTSGAKIRNLSFFQGTTNPSTIGIIQGRTSANPNTWRTHFQDVAVNFAGSQPADNQVFSESMTPVSESSTLSAAWVKGMVPGIWLSGSCVPSGAFIQSVGDSSIQMSQTATTSTACTVTGHAGSIGIYNNGAENTHYENVTLIADVPLVLTNSNILGVTPYGDSFYPGVTTMSSVAMDGKSDIYGTNMVTLLDGVVESSLDYAEGDGGGTYGSYGLVINSSASSGGAVADLNVTGELENVHRAMYINGPVLDSNFAFNCANCGGSTSGSGSSGATFSTSSETVTLGSLSGLALAVGQEFTSSGIPRGTYITGLTSNGFTISQYPASDGSVYAWSAYEPAIVLDGSNTAATAISLTNTTLHVSGPTAPEGGTEYAYIEGWGTNWAPSTGWTAYLPVATDILWPTSSALTGNVYVPYEGGFNYPLLPVNLGGFVFDSTGTATLRAASASIGFAGTGSASFALSSAAGSGASPPACVSICDQFSGQFTWTTGSSPSGGVRHINLPAGASWQTELHAKLLQYEHWQFDYKPGTRRNVRNILCDPNYAGTALTASQQYGMTYICGGS